jgi:long-chain fatty acid transport protein
VAALGRGGAFTARASDPLALNHNVAGIVGLPGFQWTASTNVGFWSHCFLREGRYDGVESGVETRTTVFSSSAYPTARPFYPTVCNEVSPAVVPQLVFTWRPKPWIAIGGGFLTPSGVGAQRFPDTVETPVGLAPSPARYMVLATNILIVHPTIAVAVAPTPWLRIGAALQPSFGRFAGETMANTIGSQSPATDVRTAANAWGFFWAGNVGVMAQPTPWITLGFHAHLNETPVLFSGTTTATVRPYAADPARRHMSQFQSTVALPLPSMFRLGARFASMRDGAPEAWEDRDPMRDEVFDVEVDVHYETSSTLQQVVTRSTGTVEVEPGMGAPATPEVVLRRSWRDTFGLRIGGDYNVIANELALRAGVSWDLGAQTGNRTFNGREVSWNPDAGIDTAGYDTFGLALGASYRWRWLTIDVAYQHIFTFGQVVVEGRAPTVSGVVPIRAEDCAMGPGYPGPGACSNNQGTYSASHNVLAIGLTGRH